MASGRALSTAAILALALIATACEPTPVAQSSAVPSIPHTRVGLQFGATSQFATVFIAANLSETSDEDAYIGLQRIARDQCDRRNICTVLFWDDETLAAREIPMTEAQSESVIASYNINRNNGSDRYMCHPFGDPKERCSS